MFEVRSLPYAGWVDTYSWEGAVIDPAGCECAECAAGRSIPFSRVALDGLLMGGEVWALMDRTGGALALAARHDVAYATGFDFYTPEEV